MGYDKSAEVAAPRVTELRELSREECVELLAKNRFGRLAVAMGSNAPMIRPVNYVFDPSSQSVAFRTGRGSKLHALVRAAQAAFEIDGVDHATRTGWSVVIDGVTERVVNPTELRRLEGHGLETWARDDADEWIKIRAYRVSGRQIERPDA